MSSNIRNIYAILDDPQVPIRRIPLKQDLQAELKGFFLEQQEAFTNDKEKTDFTGSYNVDEGEIFAINSYPLPDEISDALSNPLNCPVLDLREENHRIKAVFTGRWADDENRVNFQVFDKGKLLSKGFTILNSGDTYIKLSDPGLVLQDKLTAHFEGGTLFFTSYHNTKRILDLSDYYTAATDEDLDTFAQNVLFTFEDEATFKRHADFVIRKKIALLQKNNVLEDLSLEYIKNVANEFNQQAPEEHKIVIHINDDKLIVPQDKKALKGLISFLAEEYFTAPLSKRRCRTNSMQYL